MTKEVKGKYFVTKDYEYLKNQKVIEKLILHM